MIKNLIKINYSLYIKSILLNKIIIFKNEN